MMKLRIMPIVITILTSSAVLFGGWFIYHSKVMEDPITEAVSGVHGVQQVTTTINNSQLELDLKLSNDADLQGLFTMISNEGSSLLTNRTLKLNVESHSSPELDKWWSSALFEVAQAMETRHYAEIPKVLDAKANLLSGMAVSTEMDDTNVYVRLTHGSNSKYVILPRIGAQMGVWPNE